MYYSAIIEGADGAPREDEACAMQIEALLSENAVRRRENLLRVYGKVGNGVSLWSLLDHEE